MKKKVLGLLLTVAMVAGPHAAASPQPAQAARARGAAN